MLSPELVEKLGGLEDEDPESPDNEIVQKNEEFKEHELEDMKKAAQHQPQDSIDGYQSSQAAVNDQQSSQNISENLAVMNLNDSE